jgi:phage tail tape-measure protein
MTAADRVLQVLALGESMSQQKAATLAGTGIGAVRALIKSGEVEIVGRRPVPFGCRGVGMPIVRRR